MFQPGSIRRIQVKNFVTYSHVEFYPGPNLNMIIGPNGSGKSTMVAAIILGLGGNPKTVGRGGKIAEYVKYNCSKARIDIYLQSNEDEPFLKITREFDNQDRSFWFINNNRKNAKDVLEAIKPYNIQVNNLCQFLPQDRVQDFAKMNKQELLKATQIAICREDLMEKQKQLIESKGRHSELSKVIEHNEQKLDEAKEMNARLEGKVLSFNQKKKYLDSIENIERKTAWLQYEQLRHSLNELNEDKIKAIENYERLKNASKPVEQKITQAKKNVAELQSVYSNTGKSIRDIEKTLQEKHDKQYTYKQSIQRACQEMNVKLDEILERDKEIDLISRKIEELKVVQKDLMGKFGNDQQVLQKVREITVEIEEVTRAMRSLEDNKDEVSSQKQNYEVELRMMNNEVTRLKNIRDQRLQKLQQMDKHAYQGVLWLRNNKHLFKGEICEPMMLEINLLDARNSIFLENVISHRDILAFTCERQDDMNLLIQSLRKEQKLSVNLLHSSAEIDINNYQPKVPIEQLRRFGLHAYLNSLFTAPDLIMNYLYRNYGIHNIPVGGEAVSRHFEQIPNNIRTFFSDKCRYSVKFSKYSGAKSTRQNQIAPHNTLSISLNVMRLEELETKIKNSNSRFANIDADLRNCDNQLQQLQTRKRELETELKNIRDLKQQIKTIGTKYAAMERKVEELKSDNSDRDAVKQRADEKIKKITRDMLTHQTEILNVFKSYNKLSVKFKLEAEKIDVARKRAAYLENQVNETRRQLQEAQELLDQIKAKCSTISGQEKAALKKAKNLSNGFTPIDPRFQIFKAVYDQLPDDHKSLQVEKERLMSKIDCLRIADDGEMEEYEKREQLIKDLRKDLDTTNSELNRITALLEQAEEEWLSPLSELVTEINAKFSNAFQRMGCTGEIVISTGENRTDYSQYGLSIKVSYRNNEPLQELNSTIQSGGERAVATAAFMLSLQELTPVPFRCVDEINQGMDANNERRIFELLVEQTTQVDTAQYFFITPKLVPHLKYSRSMMIHIVHNGPFIEADKKWGLSNLCNPLGVKVNM